MTESRKEIERGRFFFLIIRTSNRILARNHVSSDGFGPQPPVTSFIRQPTWHGCRFDLARDLRENIAHSCGRVIIDFSMMSIQILFPAISEPTPNAEASVLTLTVCLGRASDKPFAV